VNKNSLFAVLLRSPWWVSLAVAVGLFVLARALLPEAFAPYAIFVALPFFGIATWAGIQQLRAPSAAKIAAALEALRGQSWDEFSKTVEEAFRRDGYTVARISVAGADLELTKGPRVSLVACKRWKAARTGIDPLKELAAAREAREAHEGIYVALGEVSDTARAFAAANRLRLLQDAELAILLSSNQKSLKGTS
jgi:restriction system protein